MFETGAVILVTIWSCSIFFSVSTGAPWVAVALLLLPIIGAAVQDLVAEVRWRAKWRRWNQMTKNGWEPEYGRGGVIMGWSRGWEKIREEEWGQ